MYKLYGWFTFLVCVSTLVFADKSNVVNVSKDSTVIGNYSCARHDSYYGKNYSGRLIVKRMGQNYQFNWNFAGTEGTAQGTGLYSENDAAFAVMFVNPKIPQETGLVIYKILRNGTLYGNWIYDHRDTISNEVCTRIS